MKTKFIEAVKKINEEALRDACLDMVEDIPFYFWLVPASSSGKYHPECDLGEGGLVRHSLMVTKFGQELVTTEMFVRDEEPNRDIVRVACLFHDCLKSGPVDEDGNYSDHTVFEHPRLASEFVREHLTEAGIDPLKVNLICDCIYSHMGKWCVDVYGEKNGNPQKALSKPRTDFEKLVHIADYVASRKNIQALEDWNNV